MSEKGLDRPLEVFRRLDVCERYSLARENIGCPPFLCSLATFKVKDEKEKSEIQEVVQSRIKLILDSVPHLSLFIDDHKALLPRFVRYQDKKAFDVQDILIQQSIEWTENDEENRSIEEQHALIQMRMIQWEKENMHLGHGNPLWHVQFVQSSSQSNHLTVVLAIHHIICDGRSMNTILNYLINSPNQPIPDPIKLCGTFAAKETSAPPNYLIIPSVLSIPTWAAIKMFASILSSEVFPRFIRNLFGFRTFWPSKVLSTDSFFSPRSKHDLSTHVIMLRGENLKSVLQPLREECQKNGIKSIHPALHTSALVALRAMIKSDPSEQNSWMDPCVKTATPMSLRDEKRCGILSGNFVGVYTHTQRLPNKKETLWSITKAYATKISSPLVKKEAPYVWFLLSTVFSDKRLQNAFSKTKSHPDGPTLLETFFNGKLQSGQKGKADVGSFEVSNTGMLSPLDPRIIGVSWKQTNTLSHAITIDVCRWKMDDDGETDDLTHVKDGLTLSIGFQKGIFVTDEQEKVFVNYMRKALNLLLDGQWTSQLTVEQLQSTIESLEIEPGTV